MPARIRKEGGKWIVTDGKRVYGRHTTSTAATKQVRAIEANRKPSLAERICRA